MALLDQGNPHSPPSTPSRFRLCTKKLFLTFPQCSFPKGALLAQIDFHFSDYRVEFAVVCAERHADGEPHLHAVVLLKTRYENRNPNCLDHLVSKHGDYAGVKGKLWQAVQYVIKDDDWCCTPGFDPVEFVRAGSNKQSTSYSKIARFIYDDPKLTPKDVFELAPGIYLKDSVKIKSFMAEVAIWCARRDATTWTWPPIPLSRLSGPSLLIARWLNENLGKPRTFKQAQLYIVGPVGCGKTHLLNQLEKLLEVYTIPSAEDWDDGYDDDVFQLAVLDEFKRTKTRSYLLRWLQGATMVLKKKGRPPYVKKQNIPTIFLSNDSLLDLYSDPKYYGTLPALEARFLTVYVSHDERIDLWPSSVSSAETLSMSSDDMMLIDASPPDFSRRPSPI